MQQKRSLPLLVHRISPLSPRAAQLCKLGRCDCVMAHYGCPKFWLGLVQEWLLGPLVSMLIPMDFILG